ncbi:hypothetical protein [Quadrisphaera granulorum]|uniref:hypothetical protein n=1 Tax=Quadrisphaera granulorum TaxID=317664 RepID=UPI0011B3D6A5|nr:hypothetical protein [Quadrisphaera granulorum]
MSSQRGAVRRLILALAVLLGPLLLLLPSAVSDQGLPQALANGALAAAVLAGSALAVGPAVASALAVLLLTAPPRAPAAVRWQADVVVRLDDRPGRPGRTRSRAPGAGTSPRPLAL